MIRLVCFAAVKARRLPAAAAAGVLLAAALWRWTAGIVTVPASVTERVAGRVVVIDPGHGGKDPGAVAANGLLEKDVTLAVALHLERLLQRAAVHVVLTRRDDTDLADPQARVRKNQDLSRRVALAREAGADLFVSIHANSFPGASLSGAQTFYYPGRDDGRTLAERIQDRLVRELGPNRRQAAAADYYVLREAPVPAVVIEVGFLSHPRESELLASPAYQRRVAEAIYRGIVDYLASPYPAAGPPQAGPGLLSVAAAPPAPPSADEVLLYFADPASGGVTAVTHRLPAPRPALHLSDVLRLAVEALLAGPPPHLGLAAAAPPGTRLEALRLEGATLHLDFGPSPAGPLFSGAYQELLFRDTLLLTLAQFPGVEYVRISVGGEPDAAGLHVPLDEALPVRASPRT